MCEITPDGKVMKSPTDEELVKQFKAGNHQAFDELISRYRAKAIKLAYSITRSLDDAEDVVVEACLNVYNSLGSFRGDSTFSTWFYVIVCNAANKFVKQRKRQREHEIHIGEDEERANFLEELIAEAERNNPENVLDEEELVAKVRQAIRSLPDEYSKVIILREFEGYSYKDIAQALGVPLGTVMSRLNRARSELKERLKGYIGE